MEYLRPAIAALLICQALGAAEQVAILQIRLLEGDGGVHVPGSRARAITVEVTDETGGPVRGAAVSFHLPENGPGGVFSNGLRTAIATTDARGRASVAAFQVNRLAGRFQIRIVASKDQARAGTVSLQYIAGEGAISSASALQLRPATAAHPTAPTPAAAGRSHLRWYVLGALAGGGIAAGIFATGRSSHPSPAAAAPPQSVQPPGLSIGSPSVSVGKP